MPAVFSRKPPLPIRHRTSRPVRGQAMAAELNRAGRDVAKESFEITPVPSPTNVLNHGYLHDDCKAVAGLAVPRRDAVEQSDAAGLRLDVRVLKAKSERRRTGWTPRRVGHAFGFVGTDAGQARTARGGAGMLEGAAAEITSYAHS